jgi:hypothetical protein
MHEPFIPDSVGNSESIGNPDPPIANAGKQREATTVEPRVYAHGIAIYVRAAYWIDKKRSAVMYIQSTDYERLKHYEQAIKKWFQSPNRSKAVPEDALARLGIHPDGA